MIEIWVMGRFVSLHSTELRCFAVAMCFLMSYLPLAAMLKSAEQMLQYAQLFPFFEGLIKSQAFLYSSLNVWFLLLRSEVDVEADVAIFKYFSFNLHEKFTYSSHVFTAMAATVMPNAFLSNVLIGLNDPMLLFSSNHKIRSWKQSSISWPHEIPTSFLSRVLTGLKNPKLLLLYSLHQWQISL